ncbi:MAG TPA: efflux RND transporter permease subunit [Xanthomonadaceae bacterium]|nr:efflux RND transporter permease subunit [Xanthomonadaceae bacterium]
MTPPPGTGRSLAALSLARPVTAVMTFVSMIAIGLIASQRLPLEQFPDVNAPFVMVDLPYPGSTPAEVERTITRPVEEALSTLTGIQQMNSVSRGDGANVFIMFSDWDRNVEITASEAREAIDAVRTELPDDLQRYFVFKFSTTDSPVLRIRFAGERDMRHEYALIEREFKRRLERLPGVARVDISGSAPPEVEIAVEPTRLAAHGIALNQLADRMRAVNFSVSGGQIDQGDRRIRVQPVGELRDLSELRELVLNERGIRLSDVADIHLKPQAVDYGRRLDGRPAVGIDVFRERNANLVDVARRVLRESEEIGKGPEFAGIQFNVIDDQGENVTDSIRELARAGMIGALLSLLILFAFLRHIPSTLMVTLAIPICFIITLGAMYFMGLTLNVLSLMGLLLGVGMLVDNAVVVVESIYQYREKYPDDPVRCAVEGTRSVQLAISAGTLTSIIVFLPNLFGERNFISIYLSHVALTITIALLCSWLVAVSLIPMISSRLKTPPAVADHQGFIPRMQRAYGRLLRYSLARRGLSIAAILLIVGVSMVPATQTEFDMFKQEAGLEMDLYFRWKGAYSLEQLSEEVKRVEDFLDERRGEYRIVQLYSWFSERGWAGLKITLDDEVRDPEAVREAIREALPRSARADIGFQGGGGPGGMEGVRVFLTGDSSETLREVADSVVPILARRPELRDVRVDVGDENSEVAVRVDRERAAAYGFSAQDVATFVGVALRGAPLREFRTGDTEVPVTLRFAGSEDARLSDLDRFTLRREDGSDIPLLAVVDLDVQRSSTQISRQDRQTALTVEANIADDYTIADARKAMEETLESAQMPPGYRYRFGGAFEQDNEAGAQMAFNTLIALVMIYLVMAALFESMLFPAAILSNIFFSALGVFWLFALTGTTFTIMASIGILVLMGVVVNNGIVMVEHINALRRSGKSRTDALVEGSKERLRPILMTMGTTVLGMIPLCIGSTQIGGDGPPYYPMARAIVGGLAFSTIVSLLFLPTIYALLDDLREWTRQIIRNARDRAPLRAPAA